FDGGQSAEAVLSSAAVVGALDPMRDGRSQFISGIPGPAVEDVVLEQRKEALHGGVVAGRADPAHRSDHAVGADRPLHLLRPELRSSIAVEDAPRDVPRLAAALFNTMTARSDFIRASME